MKSVRFYGKVITAVAITDKGLDRAGINNVSYPLAAGGSSVRGIIRKTAKS